MIFVIWLVLVPLFLCWGSFLNVAAYRLVRSQSIIFPPSHCPSCKGRIAWYDNIPVISWFVLRGKCRQCATPISVLYPTVELFTLIVMSALYVFVPSHYFIAYFIFFSALIIIIRSDFETMLISRYTTLFLIPIGYLMSYHGALPISTTESLLGAVFGYGILFLIRTVFFWLTGQIGVGLGDLELLAMIGSFTGIPGCWFSLLFGSILGTVIGLTYLKIFNLPRDTRLPYGPLLACGAILYVFFQIPISTYLVLN